MNRRPPRARAYAPDPAAPGRPCDKPGCEHAGEYRAPKSRTSIREYWWFCLDHVREYNAAWDFYRGMSPGEIEQEVRADTGWQRPTWPLGRLGNGPIDEDLLHDPLGVLRAGGVSRRAQRPPGEQVPSALREPLATLGLEWPVSMTDAKSRWKVLAKQHHPDANGGSRTAEERFKAINLAYAALRAHLTPEPAAMAG